LIVVKLPLSVRDDMKGWHDSERLRLVVIDNEKGMVRQMNSKIGMLPNNVATTYSTRRGMGMKQCQKTLGHYV
jgi:hypothetical protein